MQFPSKSYLEQLRKQYPKGTKLQLISMRNEKYPVLPGTVGEVTHIDDAGSIHMRWENGSSLALIPEIDSFQMAYFLHCVKTLPYLFYFRMLLEICFPLLRKGQHF